MTISSRNSFLKGGIVFSALSLAAIASLWYFIFPAYPAAEAAASFRPGGLMGRLIQRFADPSAYVPFYTMLGSVLFSLISIIFIYFRFEKTQSPEILFIGFFVISLSFELARILIPLQQTVFLSPAHMISASRVLLFGRYLGLFSLLAASVYAAGLDTQNQNVFMAIIMAALIFALRVPINSLAWDSTLKMPNGYGSMFRMVEMVILAITILTFFISAHIRGSRTYILIGIGSLLMFVGRNLMLNSDTWITPLPGLILLSAGTWIVCIRLHKEYLWF